MNLFKKLKLKREKQKIVNTFHNIMVNKIWKDDHSVSGGGSNLEQTKVIIDEIKIVVKEFKIEKFIDIPCGDFYWFKHVDLQGAEYLGGDLLKELIDQNKKYENEKRKFVTIDLINDPLPEGDVILIRDCFVHLSFELIEKVIANLKKSSIKYVLTTTFPKHENTDIETGGWRPINLEKHPFNWGTPLKLINENCTEQNGIYADKSLALYEISELK